MFQLLTKRKFKHQHKGRLRGVLRKNLLNRHPFSCFFLKARETALLTANQLEVVRRSFRRITRRFAKSSRQHDVLARICVSVYSPRTKKKKAARMGCAKGPFYRFVYPLLAGETVVVSREQRKLFLRGFSLCRSIAKKLPARCSVVFRKLHVSYR